MAKRAHVRLVGAESGSRVSEKQMFPVGIATQVAQFNANIAALEERRNLLLTGYFLGIGIDPDKNRIELQDGGYTVVPLEG